MQSQLRRPAVIRDDGPGPWASWAYGSVSIPSEVHASRPAWERLLFWIRESRPQETSSAGEVQQWFLATGLALRDIQTSNACEEGEPVPYNGAPYLQSSESTLADSTSIIEPTCGGAFHPLPTVVTPSAAASGAGISSGATQPEGSPQTSSTTTAAKGQSAKVKGSRRGPPGLRNLPPPATSSAAQNLWEDSDDEVEDVIMGKEPRHTSRGRPPTSAFRPGPSTVPYVLVPPRSNARRLAHTPSAPAHQEPGLPPAGPSSQQPGTGGPPEVAGMPPAGAQQPVEPVLLRRGERSRKPPKKPDGTS